MRRHFLRRSAGSLLLAGAAAAGLVSASRAEPRKGHRIVLHVGGNDPVQMKVALNNITAAQEAYEAAGETVAIELVANGGGFAMLRADVSPVRDLLTEIHKRYPAVVFSACQNSRKGVAAAEHKTLAEVLEVPEARDVPAGIVRLTQLQEQGWTYVRV